MLDTVGAEILNKSERDITLKEDENVILTPDQGQEASNEIFPINFSGPDKAVKKGDTIFVGLYLFIGSETTSVWLEVNEVQGDDLCDQEFCNLGGIIVYLACFSNSYLICLR